MKSTEKATPEIRSMAEAMAQMKAVLTGEQEIPEKPASKVYYNNIAAKQWHEKEQSKSASSASVQTTPEVWDLSAFAKLFADNGDLLRVLAENDVESVANLAARLGRASSNVSRTLKKLESFGIVHMEPLGAKTKRPVLIAKELDFKIDLRSGRMKISA